MENNQQNIYSQETPAQMGADGGEPQDLSGKKFPKKLLLLLAAGLIFMFGLLALWFFVLNRQDTEKQGLAELEFWNIWYDPAILGPLIEDYERQTGVKVNYVHESTQDYRERLMSSLARGRGPDIFTYHNTWVPMFSSYLDILPPEVMGTNSYQEIFYPVMARDLRSMTGFVGIPMGFDGLGLYINTDIFSASGKDIPLTWDDLRRTAIDVTDEGSGIYGVALGTPLNVDHWEDILALMMLQNGADLARPSGDLASDAFSFFTIFSRQDGVWNDTLPASTQAFAAGNLAMYFGPSWRSLQIKQLNPGLNFRIIPVPRLPQLTTTDRDLSWASYWAYGVDVSSNNKKEAWEFLKFLSSAEALNFISGESSSRGLFSFTSPRQDMGSLLVDDPFLGAYAIQAPQAVSWYLTSNTHDGSSGINSKIGAVYRQAVIDVLQKKNIKSVLETLTSGVQNVLGEYGLR